MKAYNLDYFLPEEISDETAYHLVNFFINITEELESRYFAQMRRHFKEFEEIDKSRKYFYPVDKGLENF